MKKWCPGKCVKTYEFWMDLLIHKWEALRSEEKIFHIVFVAKHKFSGIHEIYRKLMPKGPPQIIKIGAENVPRSFWEDFGACWREPKFGRIL